MLDDLSARVWSRNALYSGNDSATVRSVLQKHAQCLVALVFVHHLESRNVALFLEDAGNFALQARCWNIDTLMLGGNRVADAGEKIGNGIGLHNIVVNLLLGLPTGFRND